MSSTLISHYQLEELVSSGTLGEVYMAHDTQSGRRVAIKLVTKQLETHSLVLKDFFEEANMLSSFSHPNITAIYEAGESKGRPYIVTEYTEGESLAGRIALGPLPLREVIEIATQIATGLAALHKRNIIHRDLKPSNIVITLTGEVKITDFALLSDELWCTKSSKASDVSTFDALAYQAPESRTAGIDTRSDIFSFGAILYAMVTGNAPKREKTVAEYVNRDRFAEIHEGLSTIPRYLDAIIQKSLNPIPDARFKSMDEVLQELVRKQPNTERMRGRMISAFPSVATFPTLSQPFGEVGTNTTPGKLGDLLGRFVSIVNVSDKQRRKAFAVSMIAVTSLIAVTGFIFLGGTSLGFAMTFGGSLLSYECYILVRVSK